MKKGGDESSQFQIDAEDLPEGWFSSTLGDIADVVAGGTPTASDETNFSDDGYPWITPADLSNFSPVYIQRGRRSLSEKGLQTSAAKMLPKGTVLMSSRAPIGYVAIAANPISTNQGFKNFICHEEVTPEYVYYWIKYLNPYLEGMGSGSTFAEISGTRAKKIPIKYPSLAEQQRIVARVEALLSHVDAAGDRLSRVPAIMKQFRQAVLAAACSGRLTDESEGYDSRSAGGLFTDARYGTSNKCDYTKEEKIPVLRIPNIATGKLELTNLKYGDLTETEIRKLAVQEGDLIICRTNGSLDLIGKAAVIPNLTEKFVFASYLIRVRVNRDLLLPEYYHICLTSQIGRDHIEEMARSTAGQFNLNLEILRSMPIPLPPLAEQREIVRRVGLLFERADAIECEVAAAGRRCERLTQAVMVKAFSGRL